jgi:hypothetical protein
MNKLPCDLNVHIPAHIFDEIDYYVQSTKEEISGMGRIVRDGNTLRVTKVYLPKQENSGTSTDLDEDSMASLMYESRDDEGDLNFWWHSHNVMPAFWSGTDDATINDLGKNGYIVATVFNHKREYKTAYYQGDNGFLPAILIDDIPTSFHGVVNEEKAKQWDKNIEDNVVEKRWMPSYNKKGKKSIKDKKSYYDPSNWDDWDDDVWAQGKEWSVDKQVWEWPQDHPKYKTGTLLGNAVTTEPQTLACLIGFSDSVMWEDLYCEHEQVDELEVEDDKLLAYYHIYDGDYQKALTALMVEYSEQENKRVV